MPCICKANPFAQISHEIGVVPSVVLSIFAVPDSALCLEVHRERAGFGQLLQTGPRPWSLLWSIRSKIDEIQAV